MKPVLSKSAGWITLAILVFIDAFLDVIRGVEGNPLWIPFVATISANPQSRMKTSVVMIVENAKEIFLKS